MSTATRDVVPLEPLQREYQRIVIDGERFSETEVAALLGYGEGKHGDVTRLRRHLGLYPRRDKGQTLATEIDYDKAVAIARVIGADFVDVGV